MNNRNILVVKAVNKGIEAYEINSNETIRIYC